MTKRNIERITGVLEFWKIVPSQEDINKIEKIGVNDFIGSYKIQSEFYKEKTGKVYPN